MSKVAPTVDARNANLDALQTAIDEWVESETSRLDHETRFLRAVLQGRGASDLGTKNLESALSLVQEAISQYIGVTTPESV